MRFRPSNIAVLILTICQIPLGCAYHGAVFSEGTHLGMQVKADREKGVPVELNIGYDHAMVAVTPKNDIDCNDGRGSGQVGSLVARNEVTANPPRISVVEIDKSKVYSRVQSQREKNISTLRKLANSTSEGGPAAELAKRMLEPDAAAPTETHRATFLWERDDKKSQDILRARSYVLSGAAAVVATVPEDYDVEIKSASTATTGSGYSIRTHGDVTDRLASALSSSETGYSKTQIRWHDLALEIGTLPAEEQDAVYKVSSSILGEGMLSAYASAQKALNSPQKAFYVVRRQFKSQSGLSTEEALLTVRAVVDQVNSIAQELRKNQEATE